VLSVGDKIKHGQKIGISGCTGNAGLKPNGSRGIEQKYWHVHIEASRENKFYKSDKRIDPEQFMKTKFDETNQGNTIKENIEKKEEKDWEKKIKQEELEKLKQPADNTRVEVSNPPLPPKLKQ
jgi:hypothetical protein